MLNTRKLRSLRPHGVAPEVVAPRHSNAWNAREVSGPCIPTNKLAIPSSILSVGCKILMTLLRPCQGPRKSDDVIGT